MLRAITLIVAFAVAIPAFGQVGRPVLVDDRCSDFAPLTSLLAGGTLRAHGTRVDVSSTLPGGVLSLLELDATNGEVITSLPLGPSTEPFVSGTVLAAFEEYSLLLLNGSGFSNRQVIWHRASNTLAQVELDGAPYPLGPYRTTASNSMYTVSPPNLIRVSQDGATRITAPELTGATFLTTARDHAVPLVASVIFKGNSATGGDPWISDGTSEGTLKLLDIVGMNPEFSAVAADETAFLFVWPQGALQGVAELWRTDGTSEGTSLIAVPGTRVSNSWNAFELPIGFDGRVYWTGLVTVDGVSRNQLWTSDGTVDGTHLVQDSVGGFRRSIGFNGQLYSAVINGGITTMYRTLPDNSGLEELPWLPIPSTQGQTIPSMFATSEHLYIIYNPPTGRELWQTDGTPQGTRQITPDGPTGRFGTFTTPEVVVDAIVFMATEPGIGQALYRVDGEGLHRLQMFGPEPDRSCGSGVVPIASIPSGLIVRTPDDILLLLSQFGQPMMPLAQAAEDSKFGVVNGVLIFAGIDGAGIEPWRTDGTPEGTYRLADLNPGAANSTRGNDNPLGGLPELNGFVYFAATDPAVGRELFRTDGTPEGTSLFADFTTAVAGSSPGLARSGDQLFIRAFFNFDRRLWTTTGGVPERLVTANPLNASTSIVPTATGVLYAWSQWVGRSDGTQSGTTQRVELPSPFSLSGAGFLASLGERGFFHSAESRLAFSDGTLAGSGLLIGPDTEIPNSTVLGNAATVGNRIVFVATDIEFGDELWTTDGTSSGTSRIADFHPGVTGSTPWVVHSDGETAIFLATTPDRGRELWCTDGTFEGTSPLPEVADGTGGFAGTDKPDGLRAGSRVYFSANAGDGVELYVLPLCVADFDGDGNHAVTDIFAYLSAFFAGRPEGVPVGADVNGDTTVGVNDIFAFLSAWFAGCN
jgi:ELWxxDGT repeat protein